MIRSLTCLILASLCVAGCSRETKAPAAATATSTAEASAVTTDGAIPEDSPGEPLRLGSAMPRIALTGLDGKPVTIGGATGKVVLVNIWATWCGPCRAEIPELIELHHTRGPKGFEVLGVSVDGDDMQKEIADFSREFKINYPVIHDPEGKSAAMFQSTVIPTSALVDRAGKIVWIGIGPVDPENTEFKKALDSALGT